MVENNTAELMLGEARIEQLVEARMQAAKDRKREVVEKLGAKVKVG
jgi:phosphoserine phosphatase